MEDEEGEFSGDVEGEEDRALCEFGVDCDRDDMYSLFWLVEDPRVFVIAGTASWVISGKGFTWSRHERASVWILRFTFTLALVQSQT